MTTGFIRREKGKVQQQVSSLGAQSGFTALAGGGQTGATLVCFDATIGSVDTVTTTADSVTLPPSSAGMWAILINTAANSMQVYGTAPDTINAVATGTGVAQAGGKTALYVCAVAGKWFRLLSA